MSAPKTCVYVLRSQSDRSRYYTGLSNNWRARLDAHNDGACHQTAKYRPWDV
ncbi:GIY-YIG nuclease family protein, partial [Klebsiella pneumoniae]|uniref:GIY-YIG nuclease family protein n=1 Tax=Klebsiella pneumoniae TaxID=573 RepID=UPI0034D29E3E